MLNEDNLEEFITCIHCNREGFVSELEYCNNCESCSDCCDCPEKDEKDNE
ncbi:MAG: hypothetical protein AABY32_01445 [Nanoarchaeota archaeon]